MNCPDCKAAYEHQDAGSYPLDLGRGRVVVIHGVTVLRCPCGAVPAIPRITPLLRLLELNPEVTDASYTDDGVVPRYWRLGPPQA